MEYLFSYGTLQEERIQLKLYGRLLKGENDTLPGYTIHLVENKNYDEESGFDEKFHRLAVKSNNDEEGITGTLFELSGEEIIRTDEYEPDGYKRISATLLSGKTCWVYVAG